VADKFAARTKAETLATANLLAADSTLDVYISGEHLTGADVVDYFKATGAPTVLDWAGGAVFATAGAAATEWIVTNVDAAIKLPSIVVATVGDGKITHLEAYGNDLDGSAVEVPKPVSQKPGPADTAATAQATVTAYYTALAKADVTTAAALYSPQVVFQDTTVPSKAGGAQEAIAWHTKLAAVPNLLFEPRSIVAGDGWAVARWVFGGDTSFGLWTGVVGATMFEVRGGKIVRQTLYYIRDSSPFQ
jgi:ketosteroid isomerase-like protein